MLVKLEVEMNTGRPTAFTAAARKYPTFSYHFEGTKLIAQAKVDPLDFAKAAVKSPDLFSLPEFFGLDYKLFPEKDCVATPAYHIEVVCDWGCEEANKWVRCVTWREEPTRFHPNGFNPHYFFRVNEDDTFTHLPWGSGWIFFFDEKQLKLYLKSENEGLLFNDNDILFPWIGLYPEAFAGVMRFAKMLTPGEENPLTGLCTAKDGPTRVCAKQASSEIREGMNDWAIEIIKRL